MSFGESRARSLVKAIVFRVVAVLADLVLAFVFTRKWNLTVALTLTANLVRFVLYFAHERIWDRVNYGRKEGFFAGRGRKIR
ncbi:DUF2061 domain-containing protein [Candidatus Uhrbacteria bacterium]|nr:DUF2061 domain-containing protein [Candidatus Uhrbacteria bacterium]